MAPATLAAHNAHFCESDAQPVSLFLLHFSSPKVSGASSMPCGPPSGCSSSRILIASRAKTNRNRIVCISNSTSATTWGTAYLSRRLANIGDPRLHVHETASRSMSSPAIAQSRAITSGQTVFGYERVYPLCPQFGEVAFCSLIWMSFTTCFTFGTAEATLSASARLACELTSPVSVTTPFLTSYLTLL